MSNKQPFPFPFPKVIESQIVFNNFAKIRQDKLLRPGGEPYDYFTLITKSEAVVVLAADENNDWILIEEYRHPVGKVLLCSPAGYIDDGENAVEAARRELLEETGYTAEEFTVIGNTYPFPGISTQNTIYLYAKGARRVGEPHLERSEVLRPVVMSEKDLFREIAAGAPIDGALLTAFAFLRLIRNI